MAIETDPSNFAGGSRFTAISREMMRLVQELLEGVIFDMDGVIADTEPFHA